MFVGQRRGRTPGAATPHTSLGHRRRCGLDLTRKMMLGLPAADVDARPTQSRAAASAAVVHVGFGIVGMVPCWLVCSLRAGKDGWCALGGAA